MTHGPGRPDSRRGGGPPSASVRGYRARRAAQQAKLLARSRLRAVAVAGKTSRGARRADGTWGHLLGVAEHGGHLLDHLEVGVRHNETSHFTELLEPVDLADAAGPAPTPGHRGARHQETWQPGNLKALIQNLYAQRECDRWGRVC